jgi:hypothetical protein
MRKLPFYLFYALLMIYLFSGCRTSRNVEYNASDSIKISSEQSETVVSESYLFVDTTKKRGIEINYFKIEFYPEDSTGQDSTPDTELSEGTSDIVGVNPSKKPPVKGGKGTIKSGPIKSIEGYTVKDVSEAAGVTAEVSKTEASATANTNTKINTSESLSEQPAPDPYRWRYILGIIISIVLAVVGAYFIFRKSKPIISLISFVKKLF